MATTLLFYDLETSGINPREARIMQFAAQRTDLDLKPLEEPYNYLIRLSEDVLPEPDAVLITGITPQKTISEGLTEAEFLKIFHERVATSDTVFVGFNTVRFDDEFMRFMQYRNFYDPYEWQWQDGKSRWDLLDVVRLTRALRPEGIKWPVDSKGNPTNRLELLTSLNKLEHANAHDALSDVQASISLARLLKNKQPKLFDYLFELRTKKQVARLVRSGSPLVYSSGKYANEFEKTTVVGVLAEHPERQGGAALVFDLRYDPTPFLKLDPPALAEAWRKRNDQPGPRLPLKTLQYNRCPAVAPLSVLDEASQNRLKLYPEVFMKNYEKLMEIKKELTAAVLQTLQLLDTKQQAKLLEDEIEVDARLYEGFFADNDRTKMSLIRAASPDELKGIEVGFSDARLQALLPLYKARNFPGSLNDADRQDWERFRERKLLGGGTASRMARYFARLSQLATQPGTTAEQRYLLEELQLYGQSIMPETD